MIEAIVQEGVHLLYEESICTSMAAFIVVFLIFKLQDLEIATEPKCVVANNSHRPG